MRETEYSISIAARKRLFAPVCTQRLSVNLPLANRVRAKTVDLLELIDISRRA